MQKKTARIIKGTGRDNRTYTFYFTPMPEAQLNIFLKRLSELLYKSEDKIYQATGPQEMD